MGKIIFLKPKIKLSTVENEYCHVDVDKKCILKNLEVLGFDSGLLLSEPCLFWIATILKKSGGTSRNWSDQLLDWENYQIIDTRNYQTSGEKMSKKFSVSFVKTAFYVSGGTFWKNIYFSKSSQLTQPELANHRRKNCEWWRSCLNKFSLVIFDKFFRKISQCCCASCNTWHQFLWSFQHK